MNKDAFITTDKNVGEHLMSNNEFNNKIYATALKTKRILDIHGNIPKTAMGVCSIDDLTVDGISCADELVKSVLCDAQQVGCNIDADYCKNHVKMMRAMYLLTGLCYISVEKKDRSGKITFSGTKNDVVLNHMIPHCNLLGINEQKLKKYADRRIITDDELECGYFNIIKFSKVSTPTQLKPGLIRVFPGSKKTLIIPYIFMRIRSDFFLNVLKNNRCCITYKDVTGTHDVYTSLSDKDLFNRASKLAAYDPGELLVPDIKAKTLYTINTLDITAIKKL